MFQMHGMENLDLMGDPSGSMTTLTPMSETPITSSHHQLHGSYHSMNHMMSHHHHGGPLSGHTPGSHHSAMAAAVAAASLHPDQDTDPRELEAFAERFKQRRIKLGVTQADVGKALANLKLPGVGALSQSTICRFESLTLSHNNMIALKPILQAWLEEAEAQAKNKRRDPDAPSVLPHGEKKRKRTSIAAPEKRSLEAYFAVQPRPSGEKIAAIAEKLDLKKNVVRVWFCNQRQKQKRMKFAAQH
ncbi:CLUMA_CG008305, isoform A [Clunio marinus]|uniref:POU domain protein n=1 Tax=Clunio marinus TaxID=568069 RepID=A0A1J1I3N9_9DIPT|nr:CLUMA_CG008305, isoform A [Clunio marinus]